MPETNPESERTEIRIRLAELNQERAQLEGRLVQLTRATHVSEPAPDLRAGPITAASTQAQKVCLFRRIFAGRADVFPVVPAVYSRELVELIFVQPCCRIRNVVDAGIAERQTAAVYLKRLVDGGVLQEVKVGREKLFINARLMRLRTMEKPGDLSFGARKRNAGDGPGPPNNPR